MITICRAQVGKYKGADGLDITVKSGQGFARFLAPTWGMVRQYKNGQMNEEEYAKIYHGLLRRCIDKQSAQCIAALAENNRLTFLCYCPDGAFCHTVLAARWLAQRWPELFRTEL